MPQDVFNMCAVSAARYIDAEGSTVEEFAKLITDSYRRDYIDDNIEKDIITAAHKVASLMASVFPGEKVSSALLQTQFCIKKYHPNGKKKFFLQGQLFNKQKTPLTNRVTQCAANVMTYHLGTLSGTFPIAPKGWSL